jgi:hypothetical protein
MFRVKLVLIGLGCAIVFWGFQEYRVSEGTSTEPVAVELDKLEAGDELPNNHIKIGEHIGVMGGVIYEYSQSKYSTAEPTASTSVSVAYYPIISTSHTFAREMAKLQENVLPGGLGANILDQLTIPTIDSFTVLVKTKQFDSVGDIPSGFLHQDSVKGLVINRIDSLDSEEEKLIKENFPSLDIDKVLILEQDRTPASLFKSMGMMAGGMLLALVGVGLFFVGGGETASTEDQIGT